jgi:diguanylate cyclase (GGDEF)-like protein
MSIVGWDHTRGPAAMARWLGILYVCGSTLSLVSLALPHWHQQDTRATAICALLGYPMGGILFLWGRHLPRWAFHGILGIGTAIITLGVYLGHNAGGSLTASVFYIWVALYAFNFFSRRAATSHVAWIALCYGTVLWSQHVEGGAAQWLLVVGTALVSGLVVAALVEEVRSVARRDGLTGLWNRRALEEDLERVLAAATRESSEVALAIIDLDYFKVCNDTLGHHGADALLMQLATAWTAALRPTELLARFGGDEFAIVFPRTTQCDAVAVLERLRAAAPSGVTFSAGVASWTPGEAADALEGRADALLYEAKHQGRDRIVASASAMEASTRS